MVRASELRRISLFQNLNDSELERIAPLLKLEEYPRGTVILREGESGTRLYLILKGKVRVSQQIPGLGEEALAILGEGEVVGEMALLDDAPRAADVIAHEDVQLLSLERSDFENLLFLDKELAYTVLWEIVHTLARRLREANEKLKAFLALSRF